MITLKTLPDATAQQVFDQVVMHLMTQRRRAVSEDGACNYRQGDLMCAAGCLIGDDEYDEGYERLGSWGSLVSRGTVPKEHIFLIQDLQDAHDENPVWDWPHKLIGVARKFKLSDTAVRNMLPDFNKAIKDD